jgi:hypothetical protein
MDTYKSDRSPALSNLLAHYLAHSPRNLPGGDGMLVEEVIRDYPAAARVRAVPGEVELCNRHPNLAPQVIAFFFEGTRSANLG